MPTKRVAVRTAFLALGAAALLAPRTSWGQAGYGRAGGLQQGYGNQRAGMAQSPLGGAFAQSGVFGQSSFAAGAGGSVFGGGMTGGAFGGFGGQQGGMLGQGMQGGGALGGFGQAGGQLGQRNFVGRDSGEVLNYFQQTNGQTLGNRQFGRAGALENANQQRESQRRWREEQNVAPPVRVQLRPAFDLPVPAAPSGVVQARMRMRLGQAMLQRGVSGAQMSFNGRQLTLTGVVGSERDRALIERLASLEPGVSQIDNQLRIAAPDDDDSQPAGASR